VKLGMYGTLLAASVATLGLLASRSESSSKTGNAIATGPPRPVMLELFTSEGCSSCPPADRLLETLDRSQPVAGARIIVLSEHVDYWNRLGWTDPFSSTLFTERQQDYVGRLHLDGAYTPQMVVDGRKDVVGSDERAVRAAIVQAQTQLKASVELKAQRAGTAADIAIDARGAGPRIRVYVALAEDHTRSQVTRGENAGRNLSHVAVVRALLLAGKTDERGTFVKHLTMPLNDANTGKLRIVVFLQNSDSRIVGADETHL
jgi:hypothetical protein